MSNKERMQIQRQEMPEQDPNIRCSNFKEVNLGFTADMAKTEANRCLQCPNPQCVQGCPVNIQIRDFISFIAEGEFDKAFEKIKEDNFLPAICGRVCPQEKQCESKCVLAKKGRSVAIGHLERFVADYAIEANINPKEVEITKTGKRVAIVGSGPAGLSCASDLAQYGHDVHVFEALHELGGVLAYGIPEFRLPKKIVKQEIESMENLGIVFEKNVIIGRTLTIDELLSKEKFDAVFIGVGAGTPKFMKIPGENLIGVYSSNEFLTRINLMKSYCFPEYDSPILDCQGKNVAVVGGGNTAMDSVRCAKRLGAEHAYIIYRRSRHEMPARVEEVQHAIEEGIEFLNLTNPLEYIGDEKGWVKEIRCLKMELGEPDDSGRRRPIPIPNSEFTLPIDIAVVAIGTNSNPIIGRTTPDLQLNRWGYIEADPKTGQTSKKGVFAGGDIVTGSATVILAMGAGRKSAKAIHEFLMKSHNA